MSCCGSSVILFADFFKLYPICKTNFIHQSANMLFFEVCAQWRPGDCPENWGITLSDLFFLRKMKIGTGISIRYTS